MILAEVCAAETVEPVSSDEVDEGFDGIDERTADQRPDRLTGRIFHDRLAVGL